MISLCLTGEAPERERKPRGEDAKRERKRNLTGARECGRIG